MMKKEVQAEKRIIKRIINKYIEKKFVTEDENTIYFPMGFFSKERGKWYFDLDFTWISKNNDVILLFIFLNEIQKKININFMMGHHTIFEPKESICCGVVFEDDITDYTKKFGVSEFHSLDILASQLIDTYYFEAGKKEKDERDNKAFQKDE